MYYTIKLEAKDRLGNPIRCSHQNEGKYTQQTKFIKTKYHSGTREEEAYYEKGLPREFYNLPWDEKTVDSIRREYFGEDSINITNILEIQIIVKFPATQGSQFL